MARAKRTDRTEARRRYRSEQAVTTDAAGPEPTAPGEAGARTPAAAPTRPSIGAAFRLAFRPVDLRSDLRAAPVVLRHWGFLLASAIAIAGSVAFVATTNELGASLDFSQPRPLEGKEVGTASNLSYLVLSLFVAPPPAAGSFLIGFLAPRASWLSGLVFGIVATACYAYVLASPAGRLLAGGEDPQIFVANAAALSPVGAALFASAAAWYRRFLDLANPNRRARQARGQQARGGGRATGRGRARPLASRAADRRR